MLLSSPLGLFDGNNPDKDDSRLAAAITLGGLWGGFALGAHLTRDMAPDYRFRTSNKPTALLSPTMIQHAPGLALVGSF